MSWVDWGILLGGLAVIFATLKWMFAGLKGGNGRGGPPGGFGGMGW